MITVTAKLWLWSGGRWLRAGAGCRREQAGKDDEYGPFMVRSL